MSAKWTEDDEEFRIEGVRGSLKSKPRFSFNEVKLLLQAVKRNRYIILRKFNQGVSAEAKKQTWAEITDQVNSLGENQREVRQIMKKWADLKCDGKRRMAALRGPNGSNTRKKKLGPVERMVHKILMLSPQGGGDSDLDAADDEDLSKFYAKGPSANPSPYSYLSLTDSPHPLQGGASFELSPLSSSPDKELGGEPVHSSSDFDLADEADRIMDFEDNDDALFSSYPSSAPPPTSLDPLPDNVLTRVKPVHTYSRNSQSQNHTQNPTTSSSSSSSTRPPPGPSSSVASTSSDFPSVSDSDAAPPPSRSPSGSKVTASSSSSLAAPPSSLPPPPPASSSPCVAADDATSQPAASSTSIPPLPPASSSSVPSSNSHQPPPSSSGLPPSQHPSTSGTNPSDPLPAGASTRRQPDQVAQMASQSLQQQRASRMLLTSVSQSLEVLAQSVQLLVESQQEFVQESLLLQRETVDILKDFSNTALTMLRDKSNSGQLTYHHPSSYF